MSTRRHHLPRQRLPNRRASETFEVTAQGLSYHATVSRFDDGRVAEIFLSNHKTGSHADTAAKDSAVVCSIALQFGVPLGVIRKALMRDSHGRPNGPLGVALDLLAAEEGASGCDGKVTTITPLTTMGEIRARTKTSFVIEGDHPVQVAVAWHPVTPS
jgi:ribonucleoside-diphosphate reductase alpha chain